MTREHLNFSKRSKLCVIYCLATCSYLRGSVIFVKGFQLRHSTFIICPQTKAGVAVAVDAAGTGGTARGARPLPARSAL